MSTPAPAVQPSLVRLVTLLGMTTLAASAGPAMAADQPPQQWDGLERRQSKTLDHVYVRPGVQFAAYQRVRLDPVTVEFDKNWDPNHGTRSLSGRLSSSDIQRIRSDLATEFRKVLADTLAKGGYPLVEEDGEEVLRVTASMVNVYINAPARSAAATSATYVMESGRITVFLELRDSVTGQVLARAVDTTQGTRSGHLQWAGSVSNSAEAKQAFMEWATQLRKALDTVNGKAPPR
jgi:hypothetical protein